jgi:Heat shock transcription factor
MKKTEGKSIFLENLVCILDQNTYSDIISWSEDGHSFMIHNIKEFSEQVLPLHFKHKNFSSFHRQLNLYGFTRDKRTSKGKCFKHSLFVRDRHDLISKIQKKSKDSALPIMLKKVSPASKYLFICNAMNELHAKNLKIGENLTCLTEKVDDLVKHNKMIIDGNDSSSKDLERANNIFIYFVN